MVESYVRLKGSFARAGVELTARALQNNVWAEIAVSAAGIESVRSWRLLCMLVAVLSAASCSHTVSRQTVSPDAFLRAAPAGQHDGADKATVLMKPPHKAYILRAPEAVEGGVCGMTALSPQRVCIREDAIDRLILTFREGVDVPATIAAWTVLVPLVAPVTLPAQAYDAVVTTERESEEMQRLADDVAAGRAWLLDAS